MGVQYGTWVKKKSGHLWSLFKKNPEDEARLTIRVMSHALKLDLLENQLRE